MAFGKIRTETSEAILFGLPGNPVAVMVTFYAFVQTILLWMNGAEESHLPKIQAKISTAFKKRAGRTEFLRAKLMTDSEGVVWVNPHGHQGSGVLRSMSESDCLIQLAPDTTELIAGEMVTVLIFRGLI